MPEETGIVEREQHRAELVNAEGRRVIRSFSDQLRENGTLEQALKEDVKRTERRKLFESPIDSEDKEDELDTFTQTWMTFVKDHANPPAKKKWFGLRKSSTDKKIQSVAAENFKDLEEVVKETQSKWEASSGNAGKYFNKICTTLDGHKALFNVFPTDSIYTSFFCGSIQILIGASVAHQRVAERLSRGLLEICDEVASCVELLSVMDVEPMRKKLSAIYLQVFEFFQLAMKWFYGNKLISSFDGGLFNNFDDRIAKIKQSVASMHRLGNTAGLAEGRENRLLAQDTRALAYSNYRMLKAYGERFEELEKEVKRSEVGRSMTHNLLDMFRSANTEKRLVIEYRPSSDNGANESIAIFSEEPTRFVEIDNKEDVMNSLKALEPLISNTTTKPPPLTALPMYGESLLIYSLQKWISAKNSRSLWVIGPADNRTPSGMSPAAAKIIAAGRSSNAPIISHFSRRPTVQSIPETQGQEEAAMLGLVYDLIVQLADFLASEIDSQLDLSEKRLAKLDGTTKSWKDCIDIFGELLLAAPPLLFCVIDGLDKLDQKEGAAMCSTFLSTFRDCQMRVGDAKVIKLLLTTSGVSRGLIDALPNSERYWAESDMDNTDDRQEQVIQVGFPR